jgi:D-galactose 1-dehydrogenase
VIVKKADLHIPVNCDAPIQVEMDMTTGSGVPIRAEYDFLQTGIQTWSIYIEDTKGEKLAIHLGGTELEINGHVKIKEKEAEYPGLYAHFLDLINKGQSDADFQPLRIVADAMLLGKRIAAPEYIE